MAPLRPWAVVLLAASLLAGCVMFEQAPAPLTCDPALVGHWIPLPDSPQDRVPLGKDDYADVDATCHVRLRDNNRQDEPGFDALGFEVDGDRYLEVTLGWRAEQLEYYLVRVLDERAHARIYSALNRSIEDWTHEFTSWFDRAILRVERVL